ncbi:MAG: RdgB/HAM1 family non-canonical purine NTP pyrophosphatase [Candidatus Melainabacteria bacterium]|nr:RdgB/HAM1 family non-canonical purine NTP pyrophosphatase [Candidatus Melainabacteria bacterium]
MRLVLASNNQGKLKELREIASTSDWLELALAPDGFDPDETGSTYLENAIIKATEAGRMTGEMATADDSGLEVEALGGRPGLHSARYVEGSDRDRRLALLRELEGIPDGERGARFVCAMALYCPRQDRIIFEAEGIFSGRIGFAEQGSGGFGFDPIFYPEDCDVTAAQISSQEKNLKSHRGQAWRKVIEFLEKNFIPG